MCRTTTLILLLVFSLFATPLQAQVTARQGSPEIQEFASPMLLELELPDLAALPVKQTHTISGVRRFVCDDASVVRLVVRKVQDKKKSDEVIFEFEGTVFVRESHDRWVYLEFRFGEGDEQEVLARAGRMDVEEGQAKNFKSRFTLARERLEREFTAETEPKLTLYVRVNDNT